MQRDSEVGLAVAGISHRAALCCARFIRACLKVAIVFSSVATLGTRADTSLVLQTTNDWTYHGTTETFSQGAVGFNVEYQGSGPIFLGVEGHQAVTPGIQQRHRALMAYVGYSSALSRNWDASATFAHRFFPGSFKEWDYTELKLEVAHTNGWSFRLDYAPDYYDHNTRAIIGEAGFTTRLTDTSYWYVDGGQVRFGSTRFSDYQYARLGAGLSRSQFNADLSYGWNSDNGAPLFGVERVRSPQFVLRLSYQVR